MLACSLVRSALASASVRPISASVLAIAGRRKVTNSAVFTSPLSVLASSRTVHCIMPALVVRHQSGQSAMARQATRPRFLPLPTLPQSARPRLLRVRSGVGRGGARHGWRPHSAGARRPGRRRGQALARAAGRSGPPWREPRPDRAPPRGGPRRRGRAGPRAQRLQDRADAARYRACRRNRGSPGMTTAVIGQPISRVDGRQKVTGSATYAAEFDEPGQAYAAIVRSTIANGRIGSIDSAAAERAPGVVAVLTHQNAPKLVYRQHRGAVDPDVG